MDKEELLKPRYKVIADYPGNDFPIGRILHKHDRIEDWVQVNQDGVYLNAGLKESCVIKYPRLFRKLEWYQDRKIDDMPMYLKHGKKIIKVKEWQDDGTGELFYLDQYDWDEYPDRGYLPATEEEYNAYIKKQTP